MKKIKYIIDFDGTIVDVWERYYKIFIDFFNLKLSLEEYIKLKRKYSNDQELIENLKLNNFDINEYFGFKKKNLEKPEYLKKDKLIVRKEKLNEIKNREDICIMTIRRNKEELFEQLKFLNLYELKEKFFVLKPKNVETKKNFILENKEIFADFIFSVGDAETDLEIGTLDFAKNFFVETGLKEIKNIEKKYSYISLKSINDFYFE